MRSIFACVSAPMSPARFTSRAQLSTASLWASQVRPSSSVTWAMSCVMDPPDLAGTRKAGGAKAPRLKIRNLER